MIGVLVSSSIYVVLLSLFLWVDSKLFFVEYLMLFLFLMEVLLFVILFGKRCRKKWDVGDIISIILVVNFLLCVVLISLLIGIVVFVS